MRRSSSGADGSDDANSALRAATAPPAAGLRRLIRLRIRSSFRTTRRTCTYLAGVDGRYNRISTFFTESFGLTLKVFGDTSHHDDRVARGSFDDGNAIVFYFADGRLVASLQAGQDEETENQLMELISHRATPRDMVALADGSVSLGEAFAADHALLEL